MWLGRRRAAAQPWHDMNAQDIDDLLFYGVLGVVLGGRLGQVRQMIDVRVSAEFRF